LRDSSNRFFECWFQFFKKNFPVLVQDGVHAIAYCPKKNNGFSMVNKKYYSCSCQPIFVQLYDNILIEWNNTLKLAWRTYLIVCFHWKGFPTWHSDFWRSPPSDWLSWFERRSYRSSRMEYRTFLPIPKRVRLRKTLMSLKKRDII